jgi:hypothetical protein
VNKSELLAEIRTERAALERALAGLSGEQITRSDADGAWSVKDILAHIVAWEGWMIGWTGQLLRGERPHNPAPVETDEELDRLNADNYRQNRDRPLDDVLADFRRSHADALHLAEGLVEEQLQEDHPNTWPHGPLWHGVAANTCWHYREHLDAVRARMGHASSGSPVV